MAALDQYMKSCGSCCFARKVKPSSMNHLNRGCQSPYTNGLTPSVLPTLTGNSPHIDDPASVVPSYVARCSGLSKKGLSSIASEIFPAFLMSSWACSLKFWKVGNNQVCSTMVVCCSFNAFVPALNFYIF